MLSDTAAKSTDTIKKPASLLLLHKEAYKQDRGHQITAVIIACPWHVTQFLFIYFYHLLTTWPSQSHLNNIFY